VTFLIPIFYVLIYDFSFTLQFPVSLNIYNWRQDFDPISPVIYIHGGRWRVAPVQEMDTFNLMMNRLEFGSRQDMLEGALICGIQRKKHTEYDKLIQNELEPI
jgi:hypothetical protein